MAKDVALILRLPKSLVADLLEDAGDEGLTIDELAQGLFEGYLYADDDEDGDASGDGEDDDGED